MKKRERELKRKFREIDERFDELEKYVEGIRMDHWTADARRRGLSVVTQDGEVVSDKPPRAIRRRKS